jgi:hypothetical protein
MILLPSANELIIIALNVCALEGGALTLTSALRILLTIRIAGGILTERSGLV